VEYEGLKTWKKRQLECGERTVGSRKEKDNLHRRVIKRNTSVEKEGTR
jgi:hypothetical protein